MNFKWLNPLEHFKELHTTPKVLLLFGGFIFVLGAYENANFHNPVLVGGLTALLLALAIQTFVNSTGYDPYSLRDYDWPKTLGALFLFACTGVSVLWLLQVSFVDNAPWWVKEFWQKVIAILWGSA